MTRAASRQTARETVYLDMDHLLVVLMVLLWSSDADDVRLVGGAGRCAGTLEVKHQGGWRPGTYSYPYWTLKTTAIVCRELDCGSAVSVGEREESLDRPMWWIRPDCVQSGSALWECISSDSSSSILNLSCSGFHLKSSTLRLYTKRSEGGPRANECHT
ncbi:CD5 antigen-like [Micropterus dolomieu]|uniref:CD5 antigen-like n=1 Tax=Micropterus dolomieu TaxID=147949 RepID=UPI001E8D5CDD|nr:CD5 antigen-like [Micropterus dolomieu]